MAVFAKSLLKRIASDLAERPLGPGELRRIPMMGTYHISADRVLGETKPMFAVDVEGQPYYIYYLVT